MSIKDILKIPYILFVIGMLDAPQVDYEKSKENRKTKVNKPLTQQEEINSITGVLG